MSHIFIFWLFFVIFVENWTIESNDVLALYIRFSLFQGLAVFLLLIKFNAFVFDSVGSLSGISLRCKHKIIPCLL